MGITAELMMIARLAARSSRSLVGACAAASLLAAETQRRLHQEQRMPSAVPSNGLSFCNAAPNEEGCTSQHVDDAAYAAFEPPPAKFDDPEHNAKILEDWRNLIAAARSQFTKHDYAGAETSLKAALEKASHFGQSSGPVATSLLNLAQLYMRNGRLADAEPLLVRSADVLEQTAGPNNKVTLLCLVDLAGVHVGRGNAEAAIEQFEDVLQRLDKAETTQKHGRAALREVRAGCLFRVAKVRASRGDVETAEENLRGALGLLEERWGALSARLLAPCAELARLLKAQGRVGEARGFLDRARSLEHLRPSQRKQLDELVAELGIAKS